MTTKRKILQYIRKNQKVSPKEIADHFELSRQGVHKHLKSLLEKDKAYKVGKPPKVFYIAKKEKSEDTIDSYVSDIPKEVENIIEDRFIDISPSGEIKEGVAAFIDWCKKRDKNPKKEASDYVKILKKYDKIREDGLLNGMKKLEDTFDKVYLDKLFYLDFYSIERFGKTKLGKKLLYAKQSQDKKMIKDLSKRIQPKVKRLIKKYNIDAVGFVPPTVDRKIQIMKELESNLNLKANKISITKIKTEVVVPQKTLRKVEDRIENARNTFIVEEKNKHNNILLIDDAVGSGSTLNEIAKQIKEKNIVNNKLIGFAITGSLKGFDVISEV